MSIAAMRARLDEDDVRRLVKSGADEDRAMSAHKICRRIARDGLSEEERRAAEQVLEFMAQDAAQLVRRALAVTLKGSPHLPRHVAVRLAADLDSIAAPVLTHSPSLTDQDLLRLLDTASEAKQTAIAGRKTVSPEVSFKIIELGAERPARALVRNDGTEIPSAGFRVLLKRHHGDAAFADLLIDRASLPVDIAERLVSQVSDAALKRLAARHELPAQLAVELSEGARERATIDLIDQADCASDMRRFVQQLHLNGRLTPSLVLRAACCGSMTFLEHSLAELAGVPHSKAWLLVHDAGPLGMNALFERTGLPRRVLPMIRMALDLYHESDLADGDHTPERFRELMVQRVLTRCQSFEEEDLDYLLERLDAGRETLVKADRPAA